MSRQTQPVSRRNRSAAPITLARRETVPLSDHSTVAAIYRTPVKLDRWGARAACELSFRSRIAQLGRERKSLGKTKWPNEANSPHHDGGQAVDVMFATNEGWESREEASRGPNFPNSAAPKLADP